MMVVAATHLISNPIAPSLTFPRHDLLPWTQLPPGSLARLGHLMLHRSGDLPSSELKYELKLEP